MEFSSRRTMSLKQQAALFGQVAQVFIEKGVSNDELLGRQLRETLMPFLGFGSGTQNTPIVIGHKVFLGSNELDLSTKPQMLRLFEMFVSHHKAYVLRDDILEDLYNVDIDKISPRLLSSMRNNLVKLVSRARANANEFLGCHGDVQEWFVHDYKTRSWALYKGSEEIVTESKQANG